MGKYYNDIADIPVVKYWRISEGSDLSELTIEGEPTDKELSEAWDRITTQIIEMKLKDPQFERDITYKLTRIKSLLNAQLTGNEVHVRQLLMEIDADSKSGTATFDIYDSLYRINKIVGYHISANEMTVAEYLAYLKNTTRDTKQQANGTGQH